MAEERLSLLIGKCKSSSDVDVKVDAVTKLQAEFEAGVELFDIEGLIAGLKSCLRTANQHLSTATMATLVPLFPLLVRHRPPSPATASSSSNSSSSSTDSAILRQALNAFLSSGGVIERLGDNREKSREKAREALLAIGSVVFKTGGPRPPSSLRGKDVKGPETPNQVYERYLKDGLVSKNWRVREQSILTLVQLRSSISSFPLRPFLSSLVDALEDGDGTVRECARQSIVEIFGAPNVTDAARTDLKKEMAKKGVRKAIVDSVLTRLLSGEGRNTPSIDGVEGKEEPAVASSLPSRKPFAPNVRTIVRSISHGAVSEMARPASRDGSEAISGDADTTPVYVASARDLENEFSKMLPAFEGKETEQNWLAREQSVIRIRGMLKGEAHIRYPETFIAGLKNGVLDGTLKALASLRTTVASSTCSLYNDLALSLGSGLDPFVETLLTHLLKMAGFTKKIIATTSQTVVDSILMNTSCHPRQTILLLWASAQEKTVQARGFAIGHLKTFVDCHGARSKHSIESTGGADLLEKCIKKGLADPNPGVREKSRLFFWSFEAVWKDRGRSLLEDLEPNARKQLQNACPVPLNELNIPVLSTPPKKSSVAAAIAASRAKAKQIATAPPTLRHQATSTSHAQARAISPSVPVKRSISPVVNARTSPPPTARSSSSSTSRNSNSPPNVGNGGGRTKSVSPSPPSSPTLEPHHRGKSSSSTAQSPNYTSSTVRHTPLAPHPPSPTRGRSSSPRTSSALRTSLRAAFDNYQGGSPRRISSRDPKETLTSGAAIPLPAESDAADEDGTNLMTFSAPWELSHPSSISATPSNSMTSATHAGRVPNSVVEDALRARAAQAESAAEQLLELVEPDDDTHPSPIPSSLLPGTKTTPKSLSRTLIAPVTPLHQTSAVMRQASLFQNSPAYNGGSPSIFESIKERKHQTGWWLKRMSIINKSGPVRYDFAQNVKDLEEYTAALRKGVADIDVLRGLTLICHRNSSHCATSPPISPAFLNTGLSNDPPILPPSPSRNAALLVHDGSDSMSSDIWGDGSHLENLFSTLCDFLRPDRDPELLEHGLFVLWEILPRLDGRDADVLALLLRLRHAQDFNVDEGTLTLRDAQVELMHDRNFTLYGLATTELCLKNFLAQPVPPYSSQDARLRAHAFGLITMAKFIVRLPGDILEEELPKIKLSLTTAYLSSEAMVRQAATIAITAAQVILQDETHLFALLEPLTDDKKNLLTYFFEKNNARGTVERVGDISGTSGMERLSSGMEQLDQRISTPPKRKR